MKEASRRRWRLPGVVARPLLMISVTILAAGCARAPRKAPPAVARLQVGVSGCERVTRTVDCVLGDARAFHVWVADVRSGSVTLADERGPVALPAPREVHGGLAFDVTAPAESRALRLTATRSDGSPGQLPITVEADAAPAWLHEAASLRGEGKLDAAEERLAPGIGPGATQPERAWATAMRGRIALRRGQLDRAVALFHEALDLDRAAGLVSDEGKDTAALAYLLAERRHDTAGAARALDAAAEAFARDAEGAMNALYYRGVVAYSGGDWRAALRLFTEAREAAERLSVPDAAREARMQYALQLEYLGRWREALATLEELAADPPAETSACFRAVLLVNIGEGRLLAAEAGASEGVGDPLPPLEEAIALHRTTCPDGYARALALSNAGLALVRRGDVARAKASLVEARAASSEPDAYLAAALAEVEGRIALVERRFAAARDAFGREEQIAVAALLQVERWRGAYGRAEALEGLGSSAAAIDAYVAAERSLDDAILGVPLGEGQGSFVADREASARALVDLLVRLKRPAEALLHARNARARVLSTLARTAHVEALAGEGRQRWTSALDAYRRAREELTADAGDDWQRPKELLAKAVRERREGEARARMTLDAVLGPLASTTAPGPHASAPLPAGALLLAYAPVRRGWVALAATEDRVRAVPFELPPPGAGAAVLGSVLLAPFAAEIRAAREVLLSPHGAARSIDVHALPHDGAPLVAALPVRYVLDVGGAPAGADPGDAAALVLSDPTSDLEAARSEGAFVRDALAASALWPVRAFTGLDVTPARMAAELPGAALLHFAGHGVYAGREGWESALPLAHGARWTVGDVVALPRAPSRVVLSACEGARSSLDAAEGLGLAQAFLVAGARAVVAPTRPVKDDLARALVEQLYASLLRARSRDTGMAAALRDAQMALAAAHPESDWAAFRALTP